MPLATQPNGDLRLIENCYIQVPDPVNGGSITVEINNLPSIGDSKSAAYSDEPIMGRAMPLKTYSHSENRVISTKLNFFVTNNSRDENFRGSVPYNLRMLRVLMSAVYPLDKPSGTNLPYAPPPVCKIKCGRILGDDALCVVLNNYDVGYPDDVTWDADTMLPYKVTIDCNWHVVYNNVDLPGQDRIIQKGR